MQPPYEASKWLKLHMLLTPHELSKLFSHLGSFEMYDNSQLIKTLTPFPKEQFLERYRHYYDSLMNHEKVALGAFALSCDPQALTFLKIDEIKGFIKPKEPVIQLKEHKFLLGKDGEFHSGIHGEEAIRWGIELIYPQLFVDSETKIVHQVMREERFRNTELFRNAIKWMRDSTRPAAFQIDGKEKRATFRLGMENRRMVEHMVDMAKLLEEGISL